MENEITIKIKEFVKKEIITNSRGYDKEWLTHLETVSSTAVEFAEKMKADKEIVFLASWLHDIGTIIYRKEDHHITGPEIAEKELRELGYPEMRIAMVKHCILSHRASQNIKRETLEAQIVADADAMAHFGSSEDLVKAEIILGKMTDTNLARKKVNEKLIRSWNKLSVEGKKFAEKKYPSLVSSFH